MEIDYAHAVPKYYYFVPTLIIWVHECHVALDYIIMRNVMLD